VRTCGVYIPLFLSLSIPFFFPASIPTYNIQAASHRSGAIRRNSKNVIPISKHSAIYFAEYAENEFSSVNVPVPVIEFPRYREESLIGNVEMRARSSDTSLASAATPK